jgi:hypothetical protein
MIPRFRWSVIRYVIFFEILVQYVPTSPHRVTSQKTIYTSVRTWNLNYVVSFITCNLHLISIVICLFTATNEKSRLQKQFCSLKMHVIYKGETVPLHGIKDLGGEEV